ncbi:hypothetical protein [Siphonobacter sp. SORGH_AS_1065]|uniref:hypothetical protein n=1 Tax=Siphonobacter sp. SORGH_AS_1065 TaxID=3041795 RepID=UPI0027D928DE|nr:hypothetical protein [Siphonobacter sp. SORGH_AS_1065]
MIGDLLVNSSGEDAYLGVVGIKYLDRLVVVSAIDHSKGQHENVFPPFASPLLVSYVINYPQMFNLHTGELSGEVEFEKEFYR